MDNNNTGRNIFTRLLALKVSLALAPVFIFFIIVISLLAFIIMVFNGDLSDDNSGNLVSKPTGECGFTISQTSLSKEDFKSKLSEYAKSNPRWQIFVENADNYYDYAKSVNVNPEIVVTVANKEGQGKETAGKNNYWGLNCPNGATKCGDYDTFMDGAKKIIDSASKYKSLTDWFVKGHYSWIGDYWYNPGNSGLGGCYYFNGDYCYDSSTNTYKCMYSDGNPPLRVVEACAHGGACDEDGVGCVKTIDEDQEEYAKYLIRQMAKFRQSVFGLAENEGVSCVSSGISIDVGSIPITATNMLNQDVDSFLRSKGSSLQEYNSNIYASVRKAGLGTRNGVAAAGISMIGTLYTKYGYNFKYTYGGRYLNEYGVNPNMGSVGIDCSAFVSWAVYNGGFNYVEYYSGDWRGAGSNCRRTDSSCVGQVGDLIWHDGHIMLIVGVDSNDYYIAEASCTAIGLRIKKQGIHVDSYEKVDYIVDMTNFYANNVNTSNYPS